MKKSGKLLAIILSLAMVFSLCACGKTSAPAATYDSSNASYYAASESAASGAYEYGFDAEYPKEEEVTEAKTDNTSALDVKGDAETDLDYDKIIYSADVTVETTQFDDAVAALAGFVEKYGGFVQSSSVSGANLNDQQRGRIVNRSANYTLRIPSKNFNGIMNSFSEMGNVPYSYTYTENVTSAYYDTQARLEAYKTQQTRLLELMEKAETVEDVITIEERLTELNYSIDSLQSVLNNFDRRVSYSTISLRLMEVREYTPTEEPTFWDRLGDAFIDGVKGAFEFLKNLLVFIVGALPVIAIIAVLYFVLRKPVKKIFEKKRAKKTARSEKTEEMTEKK